VYSLRTGGHAWLGASAEGTWLPFIVRARGGATVAFKRDAGPSEFAGDFREVFANVSAGLGLADACDCTQWSVGRPLRGRDGSPVAGAVDLASTASLAAEPWLRQAREEHTAAASFVRLAAELAHAGAPTWLVRASLSAASEEVAHARLCLDRAAAKGGQRATVHPVRTVARTKLPRRVLLSLLREESLLDGALNEGLAAAQAARLAERSNDVEDAAVHRRIAREEHQHAVLATRIVRWCDDQLAV
jgi:hypothetical protein